ncbi:hypothetical protein POM88_049035 [Heracleum sosnowskyi]|uniref:Uncharacterized protein n=1 Tax=Heracleum sosnowskyi TaxID=360622 RepID=A0AAD8GW91_9APIA|nr:hypothetical protein POM88_049035 [Heracleum sosnowskyi]
MSEVTVLLNSMDGMMELPRSYLDKQLQLLATSAYPDMTYPVHATLWDQYVRMAGDMATNLLQTYKKVITEVLIGFASKGSQEKEIYLFCSLRVFDCCDGIGKKSVFFLDIGDELVVDVGSMRVRQDWD